jgi:hypothetical protein
LRVIENRQSLDFRIAASLILPETHLEIDMAEQLVSDSVSLAAALGSAFILVLLLIAASFYFKSSQYSKYCGNKM